MIKNMKQTIEALNFDNNTLREDIQDYKKAMEFLVSKHKELQKQLEFEKSKDQTIQLLEQQLADERVGMSKNNVLKKILLE